MSLNRKGMAAPFLANTYLLSPEFMALQPSAKGWWLQLQALCSSQENAGRLVGATKWSNGAWQQAMGNGGGKSALKTLVSHGLVEVDDEDVIVKGYHHESEARYQAARLNASKGGKVTQARRANAASPNAAGSSVPESAESLDEASSRSCFTHCVDSATATSALPASGSDRPCSSSTRSVYCPIGRDGKLYRPSAWVRVSPRRLPSSPTAWIRRP